MRAEFSRLSSSLLSSCDFVSSLKLSAPSINFLSDVPPPLLPSDLLAPSSSPLTSTLVLPPLKSSTLGTFTFGELTHHEEETKEVECEKEEQEKWNEKERELSELKLLHEKTVLQLNER